MVGLLYVYFDYWDFYEVVCRRVLVFYGLLDLCVCWCEVWVYEVYVLVVLCVVGCVVGNFGNYFF